MKFNLQRVVDEKESWQWIFPQNVTWFSKCNSVRFGKMFKDLSLRNLLSTSLGYQSCRGVLHCSVLTEKLCLAQGVIDTKGSFSNLLKASHLTPSISHL